jgi:hypothetical protein
MKASRKGQDIETKKLDKKIKHFNANTYYGLKFYRNMKINYGAKRRHILADKYSTMIALRNASKISYIRMAPYVYRLYGTSKPCDIFKTQDEYNSMLK